MTTEDTTDPTSGTFRYTRPDGTFVDGSYASLGRLYVTEGCKGSIVRLGTVTVSDAGSQACPPTQPVPASQPTVAYSAGPRTEAQAAREITQQAAMIRTATGMALPPTLYAPGTTMIQTGKDRYAEIVRAWSDKPRIEDVCEVVAARIDAERRTDVVVPDVSSLVWGVGKGDVLTVSRGGGAVPVEEEALGSLLTRYTVVFPRARSLLLALDVDQRADVLNRQFRKLGKLLPDEARTAVLRGRVVDGRSQFFAAVSSSYAARDGNVILRDYARLLGGRGMRGTVIYQPESSIVTVRASWNAPRELDAHVGDVFNVGLYGRTGDAGNAGHSVRPFFERIICLNCTTVVGQGKRTRNVHVGNVDTFAESVARAVRAAPDAFAPFATAWGIARERKYGGTIQERVAELVDSGEITAAVGRDALVESLLSAYAVEPGDTFADLLNAVTRAAHSGPFDEAQRAEIESEAGRLLYVYADGSVGGA